MNSNQIKIRWIGAYFECPKCHACNDKSFIVRCGCGYTPPLSLDVEIVKKDNNNYENDKSYSMEL